ncbi:hypothetical protein BELL_0123g00100 [Botrytis elliptica]|uniref:Uncharacterized protein n=1 Tax=Botrytis elliptica TaxID=278938 RepID=A0A4Z1JTX1_9HELO|nr:hypothetical protein EAE99_000629 [Botrytis elliptica]TGO77095.1 hypothetical protein BELL_0123g00100 [Botrytis elliptica]
MPFLKCVLNESNYFPTRIHYIPTIPSFPQKKLKKTNTSHPTSRLHTQIPHNVRVALQTTLLPRGTSPLLIPSSTGVCFSPYLMHRSKAINGDDANIFLPCRAMGGIGIKRGGMGFYAVSWRTADLSWSFCAHGGVICYCSYYSELSEYSSTDWHFSVSIWIGKTDPDNCGFKRGGM